MSQLPTKVTESVRRRNPHLYGAIVESMLGQIEAESKEAKRIRQSAKPLMNKLELDWFNHIKQFTFQG